MNLIAIVPGHNSTVVYYENGRCVYVLHEEKFTNVKNQNGFPANALRHILARVPAEKIDKLVFPAKQLFSSDLSIEQDRSNIIEKYTFNAALRSAYDLLEYKLPFQSFFDSLRNHIFLDCTSKAAWKKLLAWIEQEFGIARSKVEHYDHHLSHCMSPVSFFGLNKLDKDCLLLSIDANGDGASSKVGVYTPKTGTIRTIAVTPISASLGTLYAQMTNFLGMKVNEHEYKVMGLAAYVTDEKYYRPIYDVLKTILWVDEETLTFKCRVNTTYLGRELRRLVPNQRFDNYAAAVQRITEELVLQLVKAAVDKTGISTIAVSGGVFMNVKMNQRLYSQPFIDTIYFQPASGDCSLGIGAAALCCQNHGEPLQALNSMYFGNRYTNEEVKRYIDDNGLEDRYTVTYIEDVERRIAEMLADFKIVARFKGPGEWGARSLCNRAILGNASDLATFYQVNDMIKIRDFWMPFAPTILDSWAKCYVANWEDLDKRAFESSKYMILTCDSTPLAQDHLRAAIHQKDKTLRPQICCSADNPDFHRLMVEYEKLTGMGGLMNTSLNLHGYPLVDRLEEAFFTLDNSGLKHMAIENWLVSKKTAAPRG